MDPSPNPYILEPSRRVQSFWLVSSEDPSVVIFTAQSRLQSDQQVALVEQILVVEAQTMYWVEGSLLVYNIFSPLEYLAAARSQSCLQGLFVCPLVGLLDTVGDRDSWLLSLASPPVSLGSPANKVFNHKGNLAPVWQFLLVPQVNITLHDDHGTVF